MRLEYRIGSRRVSAATAKAISEIRKSVQKITLRWDRFGRFNNRGKTTSVVSRIIYRSVSGRMVSKDDYDKRAKLTTTLLDDHNRAIGTVRGYHDKPKQVARKFFEPVRKKPKKLPAIPKRRKIEEPEFEEYPEEYQDIEDEESYRDEEVFQEEYADVLQGGLDRMDDLEDIMNEEWDEEHYHE